MVTRALIVDDEASVRRVLARLLEGLGIAATHVATAGEALDALGREAFDVVLVDLHLGGVSGLDLLGKLAELAPAARWVLMTGGALPERVMPDGITWVSKPFSRRQLAWACGRAEGDPSASASEPRARIARRCGAA